MRINAILTVASLLASLSALAQPPRPDDPFNDPHTGGETTIWSTGVDAFSLPAKNASKGHRRDFVVGNSFFKENWVPRPSSVPSRQGLGPFFNAPSCSSCHFKDGRAAPPMDEHEEPVGLLVRLSQAGRTEQGGPKPLASYGDQIQPHAIQGMKPEAKVRVSYEKIQGSYPDGRSYELLRPLLRMSDLAYGPLPEGTLSSMRVGPQVIGMGLLEAIREVDLLALEDADDRDGDGISGRANRVWDRRARHARVGRFGWKANQPSVHQQNFSAFNGDMGITTAEIPDENCAAGQADCLQQPRQKSPEIDPQLLTQVTVYVKLLAVPARRNIGDPRVLRGARAFKSIGCAQCHVSNFVTGNDPDFPELSGQKIFPYTDLLLHDMGEGLADGRPDFLADGREWRTPPLWGVGLIKAVNGHTRLLHDGRARSIEEAILWHDGEGRASRDAFANLKQSSRQELIDFVESL
jgi:CxxC motif-containing protein (DUF1111 family)